MANMLKKHEFVRRGRPLGSKYDRYLDGRVWKLKLGEDCPAKITSARTVIRAVADRRGAKHRTDATTFPGFLVVQALVADGESTRATPTEA